MAFKFVVLAAVLAYANAGIIGAPAVATYSAAPAVSTSYFQQASAPVALAHAAPVVSTYAAAPVAVHAPAIGASHQSVERSLGGAQSVSHYSKAVDSAFSSVRKFDTRITNDGLRYAAPLAVAHAAPVVTKAVAPVFTQYAAPAVAHAPVVSTYAAHGPVVSTYAAHSPVVSTYAAHSPVVSTYAAHSPVVSTYAAHSPVVSTYAAHAAPVVSAYSAAPVVSKTAVAYSPAAVVSHASFTGLGASYAW
ncbi:pupal cuticle protein G1A-like [Anoplophora glabripennis]|uniref:pupal cuticle protein G1A-like n=1 Tax=Anoplophora glabripennis TaxID=217634 RepID=UPI000874AE26|nr:pupal cuticle protein G1A-like [Anoplophora glabripennis]